MQYLEKKCFGIHFPKVFISPQGQICLKLNRLITFSESLTQVDLEGDRYGFSDSSELTQNGCVTLSHCTCALQHPSTTKSSSSQSDSIMVGCGFYGCHGNRASLEEGRIVVLMNVLSNTLRATGYKVHCHPCKVSSVCEFIGEAVIVIAIDRFSQSLFWKQHHMPPSDSLLIS